MVVSHIILISNYFDSLHYFSGEPVSRFEAREVAQAWKPWCTVATWYLWRSLDPVPVEY